MKIIIEGTAKEIAELVLALQTRQNQEKDTNTVQIVGARYGSVKELAEKIAGEIASTIE